MKIVLKTIYEDDRNIVFDPPVEIDVFEIHHNLQTAEIKWDFGMEQIISYNSFITRGYNDVLTQIQKTCEFELFHAFCHPCKDPNYTTLNWALYGNLKERTTVNYE